MTTKQKLQTEYGDIEIETVACDSCGCEILADEAVEFTIGRRTGKACDYCEKNGPISFPKRTVNLILPTEHRAGKEYPLRFHIFLAVITLPILLYEGLTKPEDAFANGYAIATITILTYLTLIGLSIHILLQI